MNYAIIAAGEGSRLHKEGFKEAKPMVEVNGERLIERLIRIFKDNQAESITIIINQESASLQKLLNSRKDNGVRINLIVKSTPSSLHSFYEICSQTNPQEICLTTVDTIFDENKFSQYISAFQEQKDLDALMGTTSFVDDEKPLWIEKADSNIIKHYYSEQTPETKIVSGGIYCLRNQAIQLVFSAIKSGLSRMRNYQQLLVERGLKVKAFDLGKIIDIDHVSDIEKAQQFLTNHNEKTILAVHRAKVYSPNSSAKDDGIFQSVCSELINRGFLIDKVEENE